MLSLLTITQGGIDAAGSIRSASLLQEHLTAELVVAHPDLRTGLADDDGESIDPAMIDVASEQARRAFDQVCGGKPHCRFKATGTSILETLYKHALFADICVLARDHGC
jgi:hypothetical protein